MATTTAAASETSKFASVITHNNPLSITSVISSSDSSSSGIAASSADLTPPPDRKNISFDEQGENSLNSEPSPRAECPNDSDSGDGETSPKGGKRTAVDYGQSNSINKKICK